MRVRKQYGERTLHFDKVQEVRSKYIFVRHMKENNKSMMRCIFCVRQGSMFTS